MQTDELPDAPIVGNPMWYIGAYGRDLLSCPERLILAVNGFKFGGFMQQAVIAVKAAAACGLPPKQKKRQLAAISSEHDVGIQYPRKVARRIAKTEKLTRVLTKQGLYLSSLLLTHETHVK